MAVKAIAPVGGPGRRSCDKGPGGPPCRVQDTPAGACLSSSKNVFRRSDGREVAELRGDTLTCRRRGSVHMLRYPPAWAFDADILEAAQRLGATFAEVHEMDVGTVYRTTLDDFRRYGFDVNRGHGRQIALRLERWTVLKPCEVLQYDLGLSWED